MAKSKAEVVKVVDRPGGLQAIYERDENGVVSRSIRKAPAERKTRQSKPKPDEVPDDQGGDQ